MESASSIRHRPRLFAPTAPHAVHRLDVGGGHLLHVEESGHPDGLPVLVVHGGPGGGASPFMRRFFDPRRWRVILFDQRGCGRSTPHAAVEHNTTADLIADMERIRTHLGIERWMLFGGSWGATLSLLYAEAHPERVTRLILRGIFLMTAAELDWFYRGGAARFFPEAWEEFLAPIGKGGIGDPIAAYHALLFGEDPRRADEAALAWTLWESRLAALEAPAQGAVPLDFARAFARIENHYFIHRGFIEEGQILRDLHRITHIPAHVVQGRYDMICPPRTAWALVKDWPAATLEMVPAGHALTEPAIAAALVEAVARVALAGG